MATVKVAVAADAITQMNHYMSYVTTLADPNSKDETKLKAAQELSENYEVIINLLIYFMRSYSSSIFSWLSTHLNT